MSGKRSKALKSDIALFGNLKVIASSALMVALSIICGKFLAIPGGTVMRFSLENMPILFSAIAFGPLVGSVVGVIADLVGCLIVGYEINPMVTLGAFSIGFIGGVVSKLMPRGARAINILVSVISAHLIGSVVIKTIGLAKFYAIPYETLMLWRLLNYLIVGALDFTVLYILFRNKAINAQIEKIKQK